jgi:predicted MPP superfamily phosphohydrolase
MSPQSGDTDGFSREGAGTNRIRSLLEKADVVFLQDETVLVDGRFYIIGRKDARPIGPQRQERKPAAELTAGLDTSLPLIFLDHQPVDFTAVEAAGADLILSGHTHRGQFFPGNLITAQIFKRAGATHYGYWQGRSAQTLVSSGAGVWGPPLRIATNGETAIADITFDL